MVVFLPTNEPLTNMATRPSSTATTLTTTVAPYASSIEIFSTSNDDSSETNDSTGAAAKGMLTKLLIPCNIIRFSCSS